MTNSILLKKSNSPFYSGLFSNVLSEKVKIIYILFLFLITINSQSIAQLAGTVDPTFRVSGVNIQRVVKILPYQNGKTILAGKFTNTLGISADIIRLNADGSLDDSFMCEVIGQVNAMLMQDDGRILIAYFDRIIRLNINGSVDPTFKTNSQIDGIINAMILQKDGKILIGGDFLSYAGVLTDKVVRLTKDGEFDFSYSLPIRREEAIIGISLQSDNRILVGVSSRSIRESYRIIRLSSQGELDLSFRYKPLFFEPLFSDRISLITTNNDEIILVDRTKVIRLTKDGAFINDLSGDFYSLAVLQKDNKILLPEYALISNGSGNNITKKKVVRFDEKLNFDPSFDNGISTLGASNSGNIYDIALQDDGNILVGGDFNNYNDIDANALVRLKNDNNASNCTFNGKTTTDNGLNFDGVDDQVTIQNCDNKPFPVNNAITIEYWFKGGNPQSAVRFQDGPDNYIVAGWRQQGRILSHLLSNDGGLDGIAVGDGATDGSWHHIAMTWQQNTTNGFKSYLDGKLVDQRNSSDIPLPPISTGWYLGSLLGNSEFLNGALDNVRVWNIARSQEQILNGMRLEPVDKAGLIINYQFNQGIKNGVNTSDTQLLNTVSKNSYTGMLTNFTLIGSKSNFVSPSQDCISTVTKTKDNGLNFDGVDDYVSINNCLQQPLPIKDAISIEYWFKGSNLQSSVRFQDAVNNFIVAGWSRGVHILSNDGGTENGISVGENATDGNWHHVAMTWQKGALNGFKSYLDGRLVQQRDAADTDLPLISSGWNLGALYASSEFTNGSLDNVRVWNTARTQEQILSNMRLDELEDKIGLLIDYRFDQGIANVDNQAETQLLNSQSLSTYTGTLANFSLSGSTSNFVNPAHKIRRRYVSVNGDDNNTGESWAKAYRTLRKATSVVLSNDTIWVAKGTYYPDEGDDVMKGDRNISFTSIDSVAIFGGFNGTETELSQRDWVKNTTILSGDLNHDDVVNGVGESMIFSNNEENSFHVLKTKDLSNATIISGFTIRGGNANGSNDDRNGGGMFNQNSKIKIDNCSFINNSSFIIGGGLYNYFSTPVFTNCIFSANKSTSAGGAMANESSSPELYNCIFTNNYSDFAGGMYNRDALDGIITNCNFSNNTANRGGGLGNVASTPILKNCIVWGNSAKEGISSGEVYSETKSPIYIKTLVKGLPLGGFIGKENPLFKDEFIPAGSDGIYGTLDDGLQLTPCSPLVNIGDNSANITMNDVINKSRFFNNTIDLGAYELQTNAITSPTFVAINTTSACANTSIRLLANCANGEITWYNSATGGLELGTGTSLSYAPPIGENQKFYASCKGSCESERIVTSNSVTVNALPTATASSNSAICSGATLNLSSTGGVSYAWSGVNSFSSTEQNPSIASATTLASGTYQVNVTDANGCTAMATTSVIVNDNPLTPTIVEPSMKQVCYPMILTLSTSCQDGSTIKWSDGSTNSQLILSSIGNYEINAKCLDSKGCISAISNSITDLTIKGGNVSQWNSQVSKTSEYLIGVDFVDKDRGWAVGTNGKIISSKDGGSSWLSQNSATSITLTSVDFVDSLKGCAIGDFGLIQTTNDGGKNWILRESPSGRLLRKVQFLSSNIGWIVGNNQTLQKTEDGGVTWNAKVLGFERDVDIYSVYFVNQNKGWLVARDVFDANKGYIFKTEDAGNTWQVQQPNNNFPVLNDVFFSDEVNGWIVGESGEILNTKDGGNTWNYQNSTVSSALYKVSFPNPMVGWAIGVQGKILHTINGGNTWKLEQSNTNESLYGLVMKNEQLGWTSGFNGTILKYNNAPKVSYPETKTVCFPNTIILSATNCMGQVQWSNGATGNILVLNEVGSYSIYATCLVDGCVSQQSETISGLSIFDQPKVQVLNNSPICSGITLNLTASGGVSYAWSGVNSFSSTEQNPSIASATTLASGTYQVNVTDANGCTAMATTSVLVNALPTATASSNSAICSGATLNLSSTGGVSYAWSGVNDFSSTEQNPSITSATTLASGTYQVNVTDANGCTAMATTSVVVNALPTATASSNSVICSGATLNLSSTGGVSYAWSGVNDFSSTEQNPSITSATTLASGTYQVNVTDANGCTAMATTSVVVNALPTATASSNSAICSGATLNLSSTGGVSYAWTGVNSFSSTLSNPSISSATTSSTGTYQVVVTDANGCTAMATTSATVNPTPVTPTTQANTQIIFGDPVTLTATGCSNENDVLKWYQSANDVLVTMPVSPTVTSNYYAKCETTLNGITCISSQSAGVTLTVLSPTPPVATGGTTCISAPLSLTATGCSGSTGTFVLKWYQNSDNTLVTMPVSPSITTEYYAKCEQTFNSITAVSGKSNVVTLTILNPAIPVTTGVTIYNGNSTTLSSTGCTGEGFVVKWYETATNNSVTMPVSPTITTQYYAKCEQIANSVTCISGKSDDVTLRVVNRIFVDVSKASAPIQNGNSWATAYSNLQTGLAVATEGVEVWVAKGTYKTTTTLDRTISFNIPNNVIVYGGFAGTEEALSQRNFRTNISTLSGDIGTQGLATDNSYHVVNFNGSQKTTLLDGFTIQSGNANFSSKPNGSGLSLNLTSSVTIETGGGVVVQNGAVPQINNCTFINNSAISGAALFISNRSKPQLNSCKFMSNEATFGSAIYLQNSQMVLRNGLITGNKGLGSIYNNQSTVEVNHSTFSGNGGVSGLVYNANGSTTIKNSIIWGNADQVKDSQSVISYSIVQGGYEGIGNFNINPQFINEQPAGISPSLNGDYHLKSNSVAINRGDSENTIEIDFDLDGNPRRYNGGRVDMGAYEFQGNPAGSLVISLADGNWESNSTWDIGRVPILGDTVIIDNNHTVNLNGVGNAQSLEYRGTGKLKFNTTNSKLNIGF